MMKWTFAAKKAKEIILSVKVLVHIIKANHNQRSNLKHIIAAEKDIADPLQIQTIK